MLNCPPEPSEGFRGARGLCAWPAWPSLGLWRVGVCPSTLAPATLAPRTMPLLDTYQGWHKRIATDTGGADSVSLRMLAVAVVAAQGHAVLLMHQPHHAPFGSIHPSTPRLCSLPRLVCLRAVCCLALMQALLWLHTPLGMGRIAKATKVGISAHFLLCPHRPLKCLQA